MHSHTNARYRFLLNLLFADIAAIGLFNLYSDNAFSKNVFQPCTILKIKESKITINLIEK